MFLRLNSQLGIVGLPTLLFFKNGRLILRFNTSITLKNIADFVSYHTGEQLFEVFAGGPLYVCFMN